MQARYTMGTPGTLSPMLTLTPQQRRALRAKAHHLSPSVMIGQHGLTPQVLHEIDLALLAHDLVKVKAADDDRDVRTALMAAVCGALDCAPVQQLGKMLVLWRPNPDRKAAGKATRAAPAARSKARPSAGPPKAAKRRAEGRDGAEGRDARQGAATGEPRKPKAGAPKPAGGGRPRQAPATGTGMPYLSRRGAGRFVEATTETAQAPASRRRLRTRKP
ncbi:MAG: YhbY family RNA-binding protein [Proteobacteria bacterium]|nr:YhbY family RNA-binding protein [Pseudomonadota bacterium]